MFVPGQSMLTKDNCSNMEKWTQAHIVPRTGHITYDVDVQYFILVQHANQLCPSLLAETKLPDTIPSLIVLLDTFELPQSSQSKLYVETRAQKKPTTKMTDQIQKQVKLTNMFTHLKMGCCEED